VHIVLRDVRQIEIDDVRHAVDIDAAGGDVGGNEDAGATLAKVGERALALWL
jgi:hypothetical protein